MCSVYLWADSKCHDFASLICVDRLDSAAYGKLRLIVNSVYSKTFSTKLTLSGHCPGNPRKRDNGCGLHDDYKFWDCRKSGQFPNWTFVCLSSLVVKCSGCCTDVVGLIPRPETCNLFGVRAALVILHSKMCLTYLSSTVSFTILTRKNSKSWNLAAKPFTHG